MKNVTIFGDSLLQGVLFQNKKYSLSRSIDWDGIQNSLDVKITNSSKMGCTITKGETIIDKVLAQGREIDTAIVEYGGNDCDFDWAEVAKHPLGEQSSHTSLSDFKEKLVKIIATLRNAKIKPILMTLPPLNPVTFFAKVAADTNGADGIMQFLGDVMRIYRYQELFSNAIIDVAIALNVQLVDVRSKFLSNDNFNSLICEDGIHPNEKGEKIIADCFLETFGKRI
ncbi:MAG: SGNH/GDSL hydrolase family protein [Clostridia bacterium]